MISIGDLVFINEDISPVFLSKKSGPDKYLKKDQVVLIVGIQKHIIDNQKKFKYRIFIDGKIWGLSDKCVTKITQK